MFNRGIDELSAREHLIFHLRSSTQLAHQFINFTGICDFSRISIVGVLVLWSLEIDFFNWSLLFWESQSWATRWKMTNCLSTRGMRNFPPSQPRFQSNHLNIPHTCERRWGLARRITLQFTSKSHFDWFRGKFDVGRRTLSIAYWLLIPMLQHSLTQSIHVGASDGLSSSNLILILLSD